MNWEKQEILNIKAKAQGFLNQRNFMIQETMENSRDGEYVLFSNRDESVKILVQFLPSYDLIVQYYSKPVSRAINFLLGREVKQRMLSIKKN